MVTALSWQKQMEGWYLKEDVDQIWKMGTKHDGTFSDNRPPRAKPRKWEQGECKSYKAWQLPEAEFGGVRKAHGERGKAFRDTSDFMFFLLRTQAK